MINDPSMNADQPITPWNITGINKNDERVRVTDMAATRTIAVMQTMNCRRPIKQIESISHACWACNCDIPDEINVCDKCRSGDHGCPYPDAYSSAVANAMISDLDRAKNSRLSLTRVEQPTTSSCLCHRSVQYE